MGQMPWQAYPCDATCASLRSFTEVLRTSTNFLNRYADSEENRFLTMYRRVPNYSSVLYLTGAFPALEGALLSHLIQGKKGRKRNV